MRKRLILTVASLMLTAAMAVPAFAGTWKYENNQWKYQRGTNNYVYNDWVEDKGNWYYMNTRGWMLTGWQNIDGNWYYFYPDSGSPMGSMAARTVTPDGFEVDEQGRWCVNGLVQSK